MIVTVEGAGTVREEERGGGRGGEESRRRKFTFVMSNSEAGNTIRSREGQWREERRRKGRKTSLNELRNS